MNITHSLKKHLYLKYPKSEGWIFKVRRNGIVNNYLKLYILRGPVKFEDSKYCILVYDDWSLGYRLNVKHNTETFREFYEYIKVFKKQYSVQIEVYQGANYNEPFKEYGTIKDKIKLL